MEQMEKSPQLTGRIVNPNDPTYQIDRQQYNTFFNIFPLVIVFAQNTNDISNAVKWSKYNKIPIRIRSGRHNYEGLSEINVGIIIDVSEMKKVIVNANDNTANVQAGVRNFELVNTLNEYGLVIPGGLCLTTGIAGYTLGGGQSALVRKYGLAIDNLIEVEMIDANGCLIKANKRENKDLFWALRGSGGGNFGICTSFKFITHPIKNVAYAYITWPLSDLQSIVKIWQLYTKPDANHKLTPLLTLVNSKNESTESTNYNDRLKQFKTKFPDKDLPSMSSSGIIFQCVFLGSVEKLKKILSPLIDIRTPNTIFIQDIPWIEAVYRIGLTPLINPEPFKSIGPFIPKLLPSDAIQIIDKYMNDVPSNNTILIIFHGLNGEVAKISKKNTAYYYRQALYNINPWATWSSENGSALGIRWVQKITDALSPYTNGVYVNTPDLSLKNYQKEYWGKNYKRLRKVKNRYDPDNIFNFPQSIEPCLI